jgi:hypothetical protein
MSQVYKEDVWHPTTEKIQTSRTMTIKGKKNSKVKVISNKKKHEFWSNTFRRKRQMSEFFSDSAFGSQSDTLIILIRARVIPGLEEKYRVRRVIDAHDYREPPDDHLAFMQDPG